MQADPGPCPLPNPSLGVSSEQNTADCFLGRRRDRCIPPEASGLPTLILSQMAQVSTLPAPSAEGHASACPRATPPRTVTGGSESRASSVLDHTERPDSRCSAPLANSASRSDVYRCSLLGGNTPFQWAYFNVWSSLLQTVQPKKGPLPSLAAENMKPSAFFSREKWKMSVIDSQRNFCGLFFLQKKIKSS